MRSRQGGAAPKKTHTIVLFINGAEVFRRRNTKKTQETLRAVGASFLERRGGVETWSARGGR